MLTIDPGFGPWQPPTARTASLAPRFRRGSPVLVADCDAPGAGHNAVTELRHGPLIHVCSRCGAWRDTGEYLGRGVVRFGSAEAARRFVEAASLQLALRPMTWLELVLQPSGAYVVLEALGSDEQLGMRLHIATAGWLQAEGEPVAVDRVYVAPPGALGLTVKAVA